MAKQFESLNEVFTEFINRQNMFFVATAMPEGRVNLSPKGMDTFRVLGPDRVMWLNLTGSGNETAAHLQDNGRITIMFCAFNGKPLILRLYGKARIYHQKDREWEEYIDLFPEIAGARQLMDVQLEMVQTSCGMGIPIMDYKEQRTQLVSWAEKQGKDKIELYWQEKNTTSIDGYPTGI